VHERALPEWVETPSAPRAFARSTRPAGTRPILTATACAAGDAGEPHRAVTEGHAAGSTMDVGPGSVRSFEGAPRPATNCKPCRY